MVPKKNLFFVKDLQFLTPGRQLGVIPEELFRPPESPLPESPPPLRRCEEMTPSQMLEQVRRYLKGSRSGGQSKGIHWRVVMGMELAGNKEGLQFPHFVGLHAYGGCGNAAAVLGDAREVQGFDPGKVASCIQRSRGGQGSRVARIGQVLWISIRGSASRSFSL